MFCEECGKEIVEGSKFCKYCGAELGRKQNSIPNDTKKEEQWNEENKSKYQEKNKRKNQKTAFIILGIGIVVIAILISIPFFAEKRAQKRAQQAEEVRKLIEAQKPKYTINNFEENLTVDVYSLYALILNRDAEVAGKSSIIVGDDISYFYIVDGDNLEKFKNNQSFHAIVGRKAERSIKFEFTAPRQGTYYIIVGNSAIFGKKVVSISGQIKTPIVN